jgi:DNA mismatch repair protein MutL
LVIGSPNLQKEDLTNKAVSVMACRKSVMAGENLTQYQMIDIVKAALDKGLFSTCPHGRPYIKKLSRREIDKFFSR